MRGLLLLAVLIAMAVPARAAGPELDEHLKPFAQFVGKTWKGEFKSSTPENPLHDVSRWEIALKGKNRPWFLGRLVRNIRRAVADLDVTAVRLLMGRIEVVLGPGATREEVGELLDVGWRDVLRLLGVGKVDRRRFGRRGGLGGAAVRGGSPVGARPAAAEIDVAGSSQ